MTQTLTDTPTVKGWRGLPCECTVAQLAAAFGCAKSTIYRNLYRGKDDDPFKMIAWKERGKFYIDRLEAAYWFNRPMREAMTAFIEVACGDTAPVLWVPADSNSETRDASTKTSGRDSLKFTKTNETR